jgi:hypothetical protein
MGCASTDVFLGISAGPDGAEHTPTIDPRAQAPLSSAPLAGRSDVAAARPMAPSGDLVN